MQPPLLGADGNVVTSVDEQCEKMTIRNGSTLSMDSEGIHVEIDLPNRGKTYSTRFTALARDPNVTEVYRTGGDVEQFSGQLAQPVLVAVAEHVDQWCHLAKKGFKKITVDVSEWAKRDEYEERYKVASCSHLVLYSNEESVCTHWIRRMENVPERIHFKPAVGKVKRRILPPQDFSRQFAQLEEWSNPGLRELILMHWVPFTDEEFLSLRVPWFEIMSKTVSDNAINKYLHLWISGEVHKSKRFAISLDHQPDRSVIMNGLLVVPWDDEFRAAVPHLANTGLSRETRFTVFRTVKKDAVDREDECSNGTLCFDTDGTVYFDVNKHNWDHESSLNETQRERAAMA